jgi:hypothetical protein
MALYERELALKLAYLKDAGCPHPPGAYGAPGSPAWPGTRRLRLGVGAVCAAMVSLAAAWGTARWGRPYECRS